MKNILKIMLLLFVLATLGSCTKDPVVKRYDIRTDQNVLILNKTHYTMNCNAIQSYQDKFDIVTVSDQSFFGPLMSFHFYDIPSEMIGQTIDLTTKTECPLAFDFGNRLEWHSSPEGVGGAIAESNMAEQTLYPDDSPFESGWMAFDEEEGGITFILRGVLKNGTTIRMELFMVVYNNP